MWGWLCYAHLVKDLNFDD